MQFECSCSLQRWLQRGWVLAVAHERVKSLRPVSCALLGAERSAQTRWCKAAFALLVGTMPLSEDGTAATAQQLSLLVQTWPLGGDLAFGAAICVSLGILKQRQSCCWKFPDQFHLSVGVCIYMSISLSPS